MPGLGTISGVMLTPGLSKNNRLYTREAIGRAVGRMRERIANGDPIIMRTHHDAGDDSTKIVGLIMDVKQDDNGNAVYKAHLYDTTAGRDISALATADTPALKTVSIFGNWVGNPRSEKYDGQSVETGDDLDIRSVDFTASPGVVGAVITHSTRESYRPGEIRESHTALINRTGTGVWMTIGEKVLRNVTNADIAEAVRQATIAKSAKTAGKSKVNVGASTTAAAKRADIEKKASDKVKDSKKAKKDGRNKAKVGSESQAERDALWENRVQLWQARGIGGAPRAILDPETAGPVRESKAGKALRVSDDTPVIPMNQRMTPNDAHMNDVALYMRKMGHSPDGFVSVADYVSAFGAPHPVYGGTADYPTPIYGG